MNNNASLFNNLHAQQERISLRLVILSLLVALGIALALPLGAYADTETDEGDADAVVTVAADANASSETDASDGSKSAPAASASSSNEVDNSANASGGSNDSDSSSGASDSAGAAVSNDVVASNDAGATGGSYDAGISNDGPVAAAPEPTGDVFVDIPVEAAGNEAGDDAGAGEGGVASDASEDTTVVQASASDSTGGTRAGGDAGGDSSADSTPSNAASSEVPAGSAYVEEIGEGKTFNNSNTDNAIQQAINAALEKASSPSYEKNTVTIVVKDGTYDGTIILQPQYKTTAADGTVTTHTFTAPEGFVLIIRVASVLSATAEALTGAGAGANVTAKVTINGLSAELSGLYFSNGDAITVTGSDSFEFNGTSCDDNVGITLIDVGSSTIRLGAGNDTVTVTYQQEEDDKPVLHHGTLSGGAGDDAINVVIETALGSDDEPSVVFGNIGDGTFASDGLGYATYAIDGGDGNDIISAKGINPEEQSIEPEDVGQCSVDIAGGAGDDVINLDATLQSISSGTNTTFKVDGGEDADRVHLIGTIADIRGSSAKLNIWEQSISGTYDPEGWRYEALPLNIVFSNIEAYTDELKGKRQIELGLNANLQLVYNDTLASFTDYVLTTSSKVVSAIFTDTTSNPFLSTLRLAAKQIYYVYAPGLNVLDEYGEIYVGKHVFDASDVDANAEEAMYESRALSDAEQAGVASEQRSSLGIYARNVILRGFDDDTNFEFTIPISEVVEKDDITLDLSCFNFVCNGNVTIAKDAVVEASEFVSLEAKSEQIHGMLPVAQINFVTVKVGNAQIDVFGTIKSGAGVSMSTEGTIIITCDSTTIKVPVAASVAVMDNHIVLDGATIITDGSVLMRAVTNIQESAVSSTGLVPVSLAVNVAVSFTDVTVEDSTIIAGGVVDGRASSSLTQDAQASLPKSGEAKHESGGFFVVNVAVHEATATVSGNTNITASDDVRMAASAIQKTAGKAVSGKPNTAATTDSTKDLKNFTVKQITALVPNIIDAVLKTLKSGAGVGGNKIQGGFAIAKDSVDKDDDSGDSGDSSGSGDNPDPADPDPAEPASTEDANKSVTKIFDVATSEKKDESGAASPDGTTEATGSKVHAVGAAAITVIIAKADAHIDSVGVITSDGTVALDSSTTTLATTISDATTITKTKASKAKSNETTNSQGGITLTPDSDSLKTLDQTGGLNVTMYGGSYAPQNTTINIVPALGMTFVNVGGEVKKGPDGAVVVSGGTTTISNASIDLLATPAGTIVWTGDASSVDEYVEIVNSGKTVSSDGMAQEVYEGGSLKVLGATLTLSKGYILLTGATLVITDGIINLETGNGFSMVDTDTGHNLTGSFTIKSVSGGDLSITAEQGFVKRHGKDNNLTADKLIVSCTTKGQIQRTGSAAVSDQKFNVISQTGTVQLSNSKGEFEIGNGLATDVTSSSNYGTVTMEGTKDFFGNAVTTTFNAGTAGDDGAVTGATEITLPDTTVLANGIVMEGAQLNINGSANYHIVGGEEKSSGNTTEFVSSLTNAMTVYIDGTFTFTLNGTYDGDIFFDNVTYVRKGESQTGYYTLSDATTTFNNVTFKVTNGRIIVTDTVSNSVVKFTMTSDSLTVEGGKVQIVLGELTIDADSGTILIKGGKIGSKSKPAKVKTTSLGASLSVSVVDHKSLAYVSERSTIVAKGLKINASTPMVQNDVQSHAGFSNSDNSLAGAISVQVNGIETKAEVKPGANVTLTGGPLSVTASAKTNMKTTADCSAKTGTDSDGVGVGAGIAVDVTGIDTIAEVADGALNTQFATTQLDSVDVTATHSGNVTVTAKAGSAGGTSATPALALGVSGSTVRAYLGTGGMLQVTGPATVKADNSAIRAYTGDAAAAGSKVGLGGAFGISVLNDSTTARLNRSVKSQKLTVDAKGVQRTTTTVKAGAEGSGGSKGDGGSSADDSGSAGGSPGDSGSGDSSEGDSSTSEGDSDAQADNAIANGAALGQLTGASGLAGNSITDLTKDRQKAQTSEGSISIAAAFALAVNKNDIIAEIGDGCEIESAGDISVAATSDTDAKLVSNASATKSKVGIGAAVAINVAFPNTKALVGDSTLKAGGNLTVTAKQLDDSKQDTVTEDKDLEYVIIDYLSNMAMKIGEDALNAAGLTGFVEIIHGTLIEKIQAKWENRGDLADTAKNDVAKAVIGQMINKLGEKLGSGAIMSIPKLTADLEKVAEEVTSDVVGDLFDFGKMKKIFTGGLPELLGTGVTVVNKSLTDLRNGIFGFLCTTFGQGEAAPASTFTTWTIAGAGASDVGVAGSVSVVVVEGETIAQIGDHDGTVRDKDIDVAGVVTVAGESATRFDTVATAAVTDEGAPDKNSDAAGKADAKTTTTTNAGGTATSNAAVITEEGAAAGADAAGTAQTPSDADKAKGVGVGASFGMVYAELGTKAIVGKNRVVEAGGLDVHATANSSAETYTVAGTDPLEDNSTSPKKTAIDASVALNIVDSQTQALFDEGSTLTAYGVGENANPVKKGDKSYGVAIYADTTSSTLAKASGFACGESTAVGAAVAVNIPASETIAEFKGSGTAEGAVLLDAAEYSEDEAVGTATAMGSDLQRYASKFFNGVGTVEEFANKLATGEIKPIDLSKKEGDNKTADKINGKLDENKTTNEHADGEQTDPEDQKASPGAALSTNLLNTQDVKTEEKAPTDEGTSAVAANTDQTANPETAAEADGSSAANQSSKKVMFAAAVSVNVVNHLAKALLSGSLTGASFDVLSDNSANYRAYATGAAATGKASSATIGAAVAVGVNHNKSYATIDGTAKVFDAQVTDADWKDKASSAGAVNVKARHTQNMNGVYAGLLGAQTIAGAASGKGSTATVAGAVSVLVSLSETKAAIGPNSVINGGDVVVKAYDKSKLAVRAGALTASGGSTYGIGASFALIYGDDIVSATVGDNAQILAKSLDVSSEKAIVTFSDYAVGKDWSDLYEIKPSVKKSAQPDGKITEAKDQALITITPTTDSGKTTYKIDLNVDTDTALDVIDLLNFLSSTNYYVEAIAGAVQKTSGDSTLNAAGSFAFVFANNTIEALVGEGCTINLVGDANVEAACGTNARMIAGAFSVSSAKVGVGASVAVYVDKGRTTAFVGAGSELKADGAVAVSAHGSQPDPTWGQTTDAAGNVIMPSVDEVPYESSNVLVIAVAPAISTSGNVGVGAVVPVIVMDNAYMAEIGDGATVNAGYDVTVYAQNDAKLLSVSFSVAAAEKVAVGGTVQVLVQKTATTARVGQNANVISRDGSVRVVANSEEFLVTVLAAASVSTKVGVAGVVNAVVTRSATTASVGEGALIQASDDIAVTADSETFMVAVSVGLAGSAQVAAGAVVNVFVFDRDVVAQVAKGAGLTATNGDILVSANSKDYSVIVAVGGAAGGTAAISGTIPVIVSLNDVKALVGTFQNEGQANEFLNASDTELTAKGSIGILANYDTKQYVAAGGFSGGEAAVGATVLTVVVDNDVLALVGHGAVVAAGGGGGGIAVPNRTGKRKGVAVSATSNETYLAVAVSGSGGSTVAVAGVVNVGVFSNTVHAIIYGGGRIDANSDNDSEGDLATSASSNSNIYMIAGSLSGAGTTGVGATVTVLTYDKDVVASVNAYETGTVHANNVEVLAGDNRAPAAMETHDDGDDAEEDLSETTDRLYLFAVSISGAGTVAVGAGSTVLYFDNTVTAELGGTVNASGNVTVAAENDSHLINAAAAVAGSGTASVTGVVAVTYFRTSTIARIVGGSNVTATGAVNVTANSAERVDADAAGITGSGTTAVSGTVALVFTKVKVQAYVGAEAGAANAASTSVTAASLHVLANDDLTMLGIVGTVAASGIGGVGITAMVSTCNNNVEAYLGKNTTVVCTGDVDVKATGNRDVQIYLATVAASGTASVGVNVLVTVVGGKISQDAADALSTNEQGVHYFSPAEFMTGLRASLFKDANGSNTTAGVAVSAKLDSTDLAAELKGDGNSAADVSIADDGDFDVTGDYLLGDDDYSADVYDEVKQPSASDLGNYYELVDGEYVKTTDTTIDSKKTYYTCTTSSVLPGTIVYEAVDNPVASGLSRYYELNNGVYSKTADTTVKADKTYYQRMKRVNKEDGSGSSTPATYSTGDMENAAGLSDTPAATAASAGVEAYRPVAIPYSSDIATYYVKGADGKFTPASSFNLYTQYYTRDTADVPVITGDDIVRAYVGEGSSVMANNITVAANSGLILDIMSLTAAGSGVAAVAPTVAVGITYSNAAAYTENGSALKANGDVRVTAWTGSSVVPEGEDADEKARNDAFEQYATTDTAHPQTIDDPNDPGQTIDNPDYGMNDTPDTSQVLDDKGNVCTIFNSRSVRVISVAGTVGTVGVSVAVAYLGLESNAYAFIAGDVLQANNVIVKATTYFPLSAAATFGLAGAQVAVTASTPVVVSHGVAYSGIVGVANISNVGKVSVLTDTTFDATTFGAAMAAGEVSVNSTDSVAIDRMEVHTFVGQGVSMSDVDALEVAANGTVTAHTNIVGATVGGVAVGIAAGVSVLSPTILTYVGTTPVGTPIAGASGSNTEASVGSLNVSNNIVTHGSAQLLSCTLGGVAVGGNVLVVYNDTVARAGICQKNITVSGAADIESNISADTLNRLLSVSYGAIAVGSSTIVSVLDFDNRAIVDTTGSFVSVGSLEVYAGTSDKLNISDATATGIGASNGLVAVATNVAVAENSSTNNAEVLGTGRLVITAGDLVVEANGRATSLASMEPGPVSLAAIYVAVNVAHSEVTAKQAALVEDATIYTNGGSVKVLSNFNEDTGAGDSAKSYGAVAKIGSNYLPDAVQANLIGLNVSVGKAVMDATAFAKVTNATIDTWEYTIDSDGIAVPTGQSGTVDVKVDAKSYAHADTVAPTVEISLINVSVLDTRAYARGSFESELGLVGENFAGDVNVLTTYGSDAYAATGPTGGVNVDLLGSVKVNVARAATGTIAGAGLSGLGALYVTGNLAVAANGTPKVQTLGRTYNVNVSGISVAVNDVKSTQGVVQEAFSTFEGLLDVSGTFSVISTLGTKNDPIAATATVGSSAGAAVTAFGSTTNNAVVENATSNAAYVSGSGKDAASYTAASAKVEATTYVTALAQAKTSSVTVSFITNGNLDARANSYDKVSASLAGLTLETTGDGDVAVIASSHANVDALVEKGVEVAGSAVGVAHAYTQMGMGEKAQSVFSRIGDDTAVIAGGNVIVKGLNNGSTEGKVSLGQVVALGNICVVNFDSSANLEASAAIGDGTSVTAGGDIEVFADALPTLTSNATSSNIGIVFSIDETYASTTTAMSVDASVGADSTLEAAESVSVVANGNVNVSSTTSVDSGGLVGKGSVHSYVTVDRTVATTVGNGTKITADFGDIDIHAVAGDKDVIVNQALVTAAGFVGLGYANTYTTINSTADVVIGSGVTIEDTFNTVSIYADSSLRYLNDKAQTIAAGTGSRPSSGTDTSFEGTLTVPDGELGDATVTEKTLTSNLTIGSDAGKTTYIVGRYIVLDSRTGTMKIVDTTYAEGDSAVGNVDARSKVLLNIQNLTTLRNAVIRGYDSVAVQSTIKPTIDSYGEGSEKQNVYVHSHASMHSTGSAASHADIVTASVIKAAVDMDTTTIYGADIDVSSVSALEYRPVADGWKSKFNLLAKMSYGIAMPAAENVAATTTVGAGCAFYVGDAAAGIVIDISGSKSDPVVRAVGIRGERTVWSIANGTIVFGSIINPQKGSLEVSATRAYRTSASATDAAIIEANHVSASNLAVYDQAKISGVAIINHTNLGIELRNISVENENYLNPTVNGDSVAVAASSSLEPVVSIVNYGSGDVTVNGLIANESGSVSFIWTDDDAKGSLKAAAESIATVTAGQVAPVWAHSLVVENAASVGTQKVRFNVYSCWLDDAKPAMSVAAAGDIYLGVTDVKLVEGTAPSNVEPRDSVEISDIVGGGVTDVRVNTAVTIYRMADSTMVAMPVPGQLEYATTGSETLINNVTLNADELARYLVGYDGSTGISQYQLPNGTELFLDKAGNVTRIMEGGLDIDLTKYAVVVKDDKRLVTIANGVTVNLTDGTISIAQGASYEMLLGYVDVTWLEGLIQASVADAENEGHEGTVKAVLEDPNSDNAIPVVVYVETSDTKPNASKTYYVKQVDGAYVAVDLAGAFETGIAYYEEAIEKRPAQYELYITKGIGGSTIRYYLASTENVWSSNESAEICSSEPNQSAIFIYFGGYYDYDAGVYHSVIGAELFSVGDTPHEDENGNTYYIEEESSSGKHLCDVAMYVDGKGELCLVFTPRAEVYSPGVKDNKLTLIGVNSEDMVVKLYDWEGLPDGTIYPTENSDKHGYKITDSIYLATDGTLYYYGADGYQAFYQRETKTFVSNYTMAVASGTGSAVTLKSGNLVNLEALSPEVAVSASGTYYVLIDGEYVAATKSAETTDTAAITLDSTTIQTTTKSYSISYTPESVDENGQATMTTYLTVTNYYNADGELVYITHTLADGTVADSEGNVTQDGASQVWTVVKNAGSAYTVSNIVGVNTTVAIADTGEGATLMCGGDSPITGDTITIVTAAGVDVGGPDSPLATAPYTKGETPDITFETLDGEKNVIRGNISLSTDGNVRLPDDFVIAEGGSYQHTATIDITYTTIDVDKDSSIKLIAGRDLKGVSKEDGTEGHLNVASGAEAFLRATRDHIFQNVVVADATDAASGGEAAIETMGHYTDPNGIITLGSVMGGDAVVGDYGILEIENNNGDIDFETLTSGVGAWAMIIGRGDIFVDDVDMAEGTDLDVLSYDDGFVFETISAAAGSTVGVETKTGMTGDVLTGTGDATITLTTDGDINSADHYLVVDLPEGAALNIERVHDYYLRGIEAVGLSSATGRDENGAQQTGIDLGSLGEETIVTVVGSEPLTDDDLAALDFGALEQEAWEQATYLQPDPSVLNNRRTLTIAVGECTGSAFVQNLGDIIISQATGDMTVGKVESIFGNVVLTAADANAGNVFGNATQPVNVQAANVAIDAVGSAGTMGQPLVVETGVVKPITVAGIENLTEGDAPKVIYDDEAGTYAIAWNVSYEQIAGLDVAAVGALAVVAGDQVNITENSGGLGVSSVAAGGPVVLTAESIADVRDDSAAGPLIAAEGVILTATAGGIGSASKPITLDMEGESSSAYATVNATASGNAYLTEVAGDMRVGTIVAEGDAVLVVENGALVDADTSDKLSEIAALLEAARVAEAEAASAAESARLREETLQRLLEAYEEAQKAADDAQAAADRAAAEAQAAQEAANQAAAAAQAAQGDASQAAADAASAQEAAERAEAQAQAAQQAAEQAESDLAAARETLAEAQRMLEEARDAQDAEAIEAAGQAVVAAEGAVAAAQEAYDNAQDAVARTREAAAAAREAAERKAGEAEAAQEAAGRMADEAATAQAIADKEAGEAAAAQDAADAARDEAGQRKDDYDAFKDEVDAYRQTAELKADEAAAARAAAEALEAELEGADASVTTGGDLDVTADSVGTDANALSTDVGGVLNVNGKADGTPVDTVNVENAGNLVTGPIATTGDATLVASGDIQVNGDGEDADVTTGADAKATLKSTGGNVGAKSDPITVDAGSVEVYGKNVYVDSKGNLVVDSIVAEDEAVISAEGNVTDTETGNGIVADDATITAAGNIGADDNPLDVNADTLTTNSGDDTNLNLTSPTTNLDATAGGNVGITATGSMTGSVDSGGNVDIAADGAVGTSSKVFDVTTAGGKVSVTSKYGGKPNVKVTDTTVKPAPEPTPVKITTVDKKLIAQAKKIKKKKATIAWNKIKGAERYVVYLAKSKNNSKKKFKKFKKVKVVKGTKASCVVKKLKKKTLYKFKVVAQKKVNGKWKKVTASPKSYFVTKAKKAKKSKNKVKFTVKKKSYTLKVGKTAKIEVTLKLAKKKHKILPKPKKIRYLSADTSVAKVSKKGKITAVKAGKCNIYVYRITGVWRKVTVTVK